MKYLLLLLMVSPAYGVDWKEHPYDKLSHVAIGGVISCAVTAGTDNKLYGFLQL
jgi:hypothetical protein